MFVRDQCQNGNHSTKCNGQSFPISKREREVLIVEMNEEELEFFRNKS